MAARGRLRQVSVMTLLVVTLLSGVFAAGFREGHARVQKEREETGFADFDALDKEINSLKDGGYISQGNWNLAQTCGHIAVWMRYPLDGFPKPPVIMKPIFWIMKVTVGPSIKRNILANGF